MLNIYEFDHSATPATMSDYFEVYQDSEVLEPIFISESLDKAVSFCYNLGQNFTVHTLEAYYKEFGDN